MAPKEQEQMICWYKIAHQCCAILRLCTGAMQPQDCISLVHSLEIGMQFPDSENALHDLKIAWIPRLHRTHTCS